MTYSTDFIQFNINHPEVLRELLRLARQAKQSGATKLGIRMLWERCRWEFQITQGNRLWRYNDHLCPEFARLIMKQNPAEFKDFFEVRKTNNERNSL